MEMSDDRFRAITYTAKRLCRAMGHGELAEDFAQEAVLKIANGRKASVEFILYDYLDSEFGEYKDPKTGEKSDYGAFLTAQKLGYQELDENTATQNVQRFFSEVQAIKNSLKGAERITFSLLLAGFTLEEIGDIFGVSEGRIGQHMMSIKKQIRANKEFMED